MAETLTDYQKDILVRTVLGEARGEGLDGMEAVAAVIRNRSNSGQFPSDPAAVALQPSQFSAWLPVGSGGNNPQQFSKGSDIYRRAEQAVERVFSGQVPDRTNGALYYHTPAVNPNWSDEANQFGTTRLGNHIFYNGRPTPPGEIPNQVASLTDTVAPRVPPNPVTMTPDLALMRNPTMSAAARNVEVTPSGNVPLPRNRPSVPDIVTPSMAALNAPRGNVNATRAVDMLASTQNPVTPRLTDAGDNIYSYHIPDMTPTAVVGGMGSLTPAQPRQSLPALPRSIPGQSQVERTTPSARQIASAPGTTIATIPTSNIGQPPTTRSVPSVPFSLQPTAREIAQAQGTTIATIPTTPQPMNMRSRDSVANAAFGNRIAAQMAPAFNQPGYIPDRLAPNPIVQPGYVPLRQPPIQVVPSPISTSPRRIAPMPMAASARPLAPQRAITPQPMPRMAQATSPLRAVVNGAGSYSSPRPVALSPIQSLMAQGMSQAQAYNALTQRAPTLEDRVRGSTGLSSSGASAYSLSS